MRPPRPALVALLTIIGLAVAAPGAHAALTWGTCRPAGFQCTSLQVPVDRAGHVPGTITLAVTRAPAASGPARTAVVALAGGPGQAALPIAGSFRQALAPLLAGRDLLLFDQRGTGNSNPLHCAAFDLQVAPLSTTVRRCAQQLGPARAFFTTAQSVEDLEALRVAGGYDKLVLYGVSYGTKVALAYAAAHPDAVQALVLDSVVTPEGPDALRRSTLAAVPRVLGQDLCGGGDCARITPSIVADVRRLAARLGRHPVSGPVLDGHGRRYTAHLSAGGLVAILVSGDLDPTLRAELPGSVRAALAGDPRPILRLSARSSGLENRAAYQQEAADNDPLFFTTACEENTTLPWTRGAAQSQRVREAVSTVGHLPTSAFGIFPREVALGGLPSLCLGYPVAGPPPAAPGPLPDVPVLVLDGRSDLRTPLEDAMAVAARFPRAQVVAVPHTGHSVLGSEPGTCAAAALAAFAAGSAAAACPAIPDPFSPTPRPPSSLALVPPANGVPGKAGRTVNAVLRTLTDARRQVIGATLGTGRLPRAVGGLRNGYERVTDSRHFVLRGYEYVPGVRVTGDYRLTGTTRVRVSGRSAARGRLVITRGGAVSGTLGGHRVRLPAVRAASVSRDRLPSVAWALARGRLIAAGA